MRNRGKVYWGWADPGLHVRSVDERLGDGTLLNVQVRMSILGRTQLFVGVYAIKGLMLYEEAFDSMPGETMTKALAWGLEYARLKAPINAVIAKRAKPHPLPRPGSRQGS
ncbi:hypothetical protein [Pseudomonas fluorescens]|uniref:hypothetical protein n=1 Tax=Pseudomonas fluorescens TaxID=294 RepID=UPI001251CE56|nr:hypothetical protein [Pseudomonas fluorescens]VVN78440.1 hypothetical protein PS720_00895 [Pseudomonas fluorescens]